MMFLSFFENVKDNITAAIEDSFRTVLLFLSEIVYKLIVFFFDIFNLLGTAEILQDEKIQSIYRHIGLILGLFMVFRVTFSAVEYIINPDNMFDKSKGMFNIVKKIIISVVLLGITPFLFDTAFDIQNLVIDGKIIPRIIMGGLTDADVDAESGEELAWYTFETFYSKNKEVTDNECMDYYNLEQDFKNNHTFRYAYNCLNERGTVEHEYETTKGQDYVINFEGVLCLIVGVLILWVIIMYTIQVGVRVIQLAYLQLIAPIPIMLYMTPKGEDRLNKWVKQCTTTYADFFIRTAVIYFVVYIVNVLIGNDDNYFMDSIGNPTGITGTYITIVMIIALLIFAKKVPDLFKELFPSSSGAAKFDFGLKPAKQLGQAATLGVGTAAGAIGGMATGIMYGDGAKGKITGALTGFGRGALGGMKTKGNALENAKKGMSAQRAASLKAYERHHDGSDFWGRTAIGAYNASLDKEAFDKELKAYDDYKSKFDFVEKELEKDSNVQFARYELEQMRKAGMVSEGVIANGAPVIDKSTGKQIMKNRAVTAADFEKANERIKKAQEAALINQIKKGNSKIINSMREAEIIRDKGIKKGYSGFTTDTLIYDDLKVDADKMAAAFTLNKNESVKQAGEIRRLDGARNKEYKTAEANAKYNKK